MVSRMCEHQQCAECAKTVGRHQWALSALILWVNSAFPNRTGNGLTTECMLSAATSEMVRPSIMGEFARARKNRCYFPNINYWTRYFYSSQRNRCYFPYINHLTKYLIHQWKRQETCLHFAVPQLRLVCAQILFHEKPAVEVVCAFPCEHLLIAIEFRFAHGLQKIPRTLQLVAPFFAAQSWESARFPQERADNDLPRHVDNYLPRYILQRIICGIALRSLPIC